MPRFRKNYKKGKKNKTMKYLVKKVKELDKMDTCYVDYGDTGVAIGSIVSAPNTQQMVSAGTGLLRNLTNIDLQLNSIGRTKQVVYIKQIKIRYQIKLDPTSSIEALGKSVIKIRVFVVQQMNMPDNLYNNTVVGTAPFPTIGNLLYTNASCIDSDLLSHQTYANKSQFKILYSKIHNLAPLYKDNTNTIPLGNDRSYAYGVINLKKPIKVMYNTSGTDGALQIVKNRLLLCAFSDNINANLRPPVIDYDGLTMYDTV